MRVVLTVGLILIGAQIWGLVLAFTSKYFPGRFLVRSIGCIALGLTLFLWVNFWAGDRTDYAYEQLEESAKKLVTAAELQKWATNVLAHPEDYTLQTNYPSGLRRIRWVRMPDTMFRTNMDEPPFVVLDWGGRDTVAKFEIGPTNFVGEGHKWREGVYFVFEEH